MGKIDVETLSLAKSFAGTDEVKKICLGNDKIWESDVTLPYVKFSSPYTFTLSTKNNTAGWTTYDNYQKMETSTDGENWTTWNGTTTVSSALVGGKYVLYVRGNQKDTMEEYHWGITGSGGSRELSSSDAIGWILAGTDGSITIEGTLTTLCDYNFNCSFGAYGCAYLFSGNRSIVDVSKLKFGGISNAVGDGKYRGLFYNCEFLKYPMSFKELETSAQVPYRYFQYMYYNCYELERLPKLCVNTYGKAVYSYIFNNCTKICLSTAQTGIYQNQYPIYITAQDSDVFSGAFANTGGTFVGTPTINTVYYTSNQIV